MTAADDAIPNVRLVAARALRDMLWTKGRMCGTDGAGLIRTRLHTLRGDVDSDVKVLSNRLRPYQLPVTIYCYPSYTQKHLCHILSRFPICPLSYYF